MEPQEDSMITIHVKRLTSFSSIRGQMFRKEIIPVYFETRFGIHTFFMKHPIDVVILDDDHVVQKVAHNLKPWRIFVWNPKWFRVLELPAGTIAQRRIKLDSKVVVYFSPS